MNDATLMHVHGTHLGVSERLPQLFDCHGPHPSIGVIHAENQSSTRLGLGQNLEGDQHIHRPTDLWLESRVGSYTWCRDPGRDKVTNS